MMDGEEGDRIATRVVGSDQDPGHTPVVFGEVLFDHFPDGSCVLGGAPFNVAWHLRGFGLEPCMISAVGTDGSGHEVLRQMSEWGMTAEGIQVDPTHSTGRVIATVVGGESHFEIASDQAYDYVDAAAAATAASKLRVPLLYHGTLALRSAISWDALIALLEVTQADVFVDLNLRDPWWTPHHVRCCLASATWLKLSEGELRVVTGTSTETGEDCAREAFELAEAHGIKGVIVTRGNKGAVATIDHRVLYVPPSPVPEVELVDTVGAGDGFSAVVCAGILRGWSAEDLLIRASRFAADLCRIRGATTARRSLYEHHLRLWSDP